MMKRKKILWEALIPSEYTKALFQEELNMESFVIENQQHRRRKNLLFRYRGIQSLLKSKFEFFLLKHHYLPKRKFPTLKEMVM